MRIFNEEDRQKGLDLVAINWNNAAHYTHTQLHTHTDLHSYVLHLSWDISTKWKCISQANCQAAICLPKQVSHNIFGIRYD